jgi:ABC-type sugar transport system substrate-binding protein
MKLKSTLTAALLLCCVAAQSQPLESLWQDPPHIVPSYNQLTPEWWDIWSYAVREADRLGVQLSFNACDGWAVAGGPGSIERDHLVLNNVYFAYLWTRKR